MNRLEQLSAIKKTVVDAWCESIVTSYPKETADFLRRTGDRFDNPVGHTLTENSEKLFEQLLGEIDRDETMRLLDEVIRIRALQKFTASEAVNFVFDLKRIVAGQVAKAPDDGGLQEEVSILESRIDEMALLAFDVFMKCRESLYEIRANDARRQTSILLQRLNKRRAEPN